MTDNEIIKYLEQAIDEYDKNEISVSNIRLDKLSLDLIKRQQTDIDNLRADLKRVCAERDAHICTNNFIKAQAIKEFAERLVYTLCINNEENTEFFDYAYTLETINNLVKELISDE